MIGRVARRFAVLAATVAVPCSAAAQDDGATGHRCVIEPALTVNVGSAMAGLLDEVAVDRGSRVERGQMLARLTTGVEQATVDLARAQAADATAIAASRARLEQKTGELARAEQLLARQVVAVEAVEALRAEVEVERQVLRQAEIGQSLAALDLARTEVLLGERTIESPIDGVVTRRLLSAGEYVHQEAHILELAQIDPLHVEVFLPAAMYGQVVEGMTATVLPQDPIGGSHEARVTVVDSVLDPASGTFGVRLELPNPAFATPAGIRCTVAFPAAQDGSGS